MASLVLYRDTQTVHARVYCSRWIADCPVCKSALALNPGTPTFECWECSERIQVLWPDEEMVAGVERLLSMRRIHHTRNWWPGETLNDLMAENATHGVFAPLLAAVPHIPGESVLHAEEGRIVKDILPALPDRIRLAVEA